MPSRQPPADPMLARPTIYATCIRNPREDFSGRPILGPVGRRRRVPRLPIVGGPRMLVDSGAPSARSSDHPKAQASARRRSSAAPGRTCSRIRRGRAKPSALEARGARAFAPPPDRTWWASARPAPRGGLRRAPALLAGDKKLFVQTCGRVRLLRDTQRSTESARRGPRLLIRWSAVRIRHDLPTFSGLERHPTAQKP